MLGALLNRFAPTLLSAPSVWGKLPSYGDFAYQNAQTEDRAAWQEWFLHYPLSELGELAQPAIPVTTPRSAGWVSLDLPKPQKNINARPWCFAFPAGTLPAAPHLPAQRLIIGVVAESCDKVGRKHPIVIWHSLCVEGCFHLKDPFNWCYWLARCLHDHLPRPASFEPPHGEHDFMTQLNFLWKEAAPTLSARLRFFWKLLPKSELEAMLQSFRPSSAARADLRSKRPDLPDPQSGVRQLPWHQWPELLLPENATHRAGYFWQQSDDGEYIQFATLPSRWKNGALV